MQETTFGEIERFNSYAAANPAAVAQMLADVKGLDDIVSVANRLNFGFTTADAQQYVREKTQANLTDEQLAMIVGGSTWSLTFSWTLAWTLGVAVLQADIAAEVVTVAIVVLAAVAFVL